MGGIRPPSVRLLRRAYSVAAAEAFSASRVGGWWQTASPQTSPTNESSIAFALKIWQVILLKYLLFFFDQSRIFSRLSCYQCEYSEHGIQLAGSLFIGAEFAN
jgi:hypothetical protein